MIFLEQITNQILKEEGQVILSISDLGVTWDDLATLFEGTYEQAKDYLSIYDWTSDVIGLQPKKSDYSHIRHISYNAYYQRFMPDVPGNYWEFNPYTKDTSALMNTNFSLEVAKPATLDYLDYTLTLKNIKKGKKKRFTLPFVPTDDITVKPANSLEELSVDVSEVTFNSNNKNTYLDNTKDCICDSTENSTELQYSGDMNGTFNPNKLVGEVKFTKNYDELKLDFTTKYKGILELDMSCELFYQWYKGNLLTMIGSIKSQIDLSSAGLPFDFNQDRLLDRGREILNLVNTELKNSKQHWSNF